MHENDDPQEQTQVMADALGMPTLVLYWPDGRGIEISDVRELRTFLKSQGLSRLQTAGQMAVMIETFGGIVGVPYLIGQMLHDYADEIVFLVPNKAYSGGTEICLSGNQIIFGEDATLSPIDTQVPDAVGNRWSDTAIHNFRELADGAEHDATRAAIIEATIGFISPPTIAEVYRLSRMATQHARVLLQTYMLKDSSEEQIEHVLAWLTHLAPSHEWEIDYHLARDIGLKVQRMGEELSDFTKQLAATLAHEVAAEERLDGNSKNDLYLIYAVPSGEDCGGKDAAESEDESDKGLPAQFGENGDREFSVSTSDAARD